MEDGQDREALRSSEAESTADFLANLGKALLKKEGIDVGLADILAKHLLTTAPCDNAIDKAKKAIVELAVVRATLPAAPEVDDG